jgi:uncharacterized membrane protein
MANLVNSQTGLIHLLSAIIALIFGTLILSFRKGTTLHKTFGYIYVVSMIILNVTSFLIYHLFDRWGAFHYAAVISTLTLLAGFIPVFTKKPIKSWLHLHITFMYYSVIGLYAAFASETLVRIPGVGFWWVVVGATTVVMAAGLIVFQLTSKKWLKKSPQNQQ